MPMHVEHRLTYHDHQDRLAAEACRRAAELENGDTPVKCAHRRHVLAVASRDRGEVEARRGRHAA